MNTDTIFTIYFGSESELKGAFTKPYRPVAYQQLTDLARRRGALLLFACGDQYRGNCQFSSGRQFIDGKPQEYSTPFTAAAIYCIGLGTGTIPPIDTDLPIVNNPALDAIGDDKEKQYELLKEFQATSARIDRKNWRDVVSQLVTDRIVMKPTTGSGGEGIRILNRTEIQEQDILTDRQYIAQEYVDTSGGIQGVYDGSHDWRLLVFNGEVKLNFLRMTKAGSDLANVAQGATIWEVPNERIPRAALDIAKKVDAKFTNFFPRLMSVDFMFGPDRPYVTEINTRPGLAIPTFESQDFCTKYYTYLLDLLFQAREQAL